MIVTGLIGILILVGTLTMPGDWFNRLPGIGFALFFFWLAWDMRSIPSNPVEFKIKKHYKDHDGRPVYIVQANNTREAARPIELTTYPGGHWTISQTGANEYMLHVEDNV